MDTGTKIGLGLAALACLVAIGSLFFDWQGWLRDRRAAATLPQPDQTHLKAIIRLATGPGTGFKFKRSRTDNAITITFRNEGLHPAYNFRPTVKSGDWEAPGHATGITIPAHQERFFQFPFPYERFPLDGGHHFTLTALYRDGTGDRTFTMRFHFVGHEQPIPRWRPVIESEE